MIPISTQAICSQGSHPLQDRVPTKPICVRFDFALIDKLDALAVHMGLTRSEIIRSCVAEGVKQIEKELLTEGL